MDSKSKGIAAIAVFSLLLTGCGGGGGGDDGPTPTSESPGASNTALQNAVGAIDFGLGAMSGSLKPSLKPFKKGKARDLGASMAGFYKGLKAYRAKGISALTDLSFLCDSGTAHTDSSTETSFSITYTDCTAGIDTNADDIPDEEEYTDGTISFSETPSGFSFTITGRTADTKFTERTTHISDNHLLEEEILDLTVTGTFGTSTLDCSGVPVPASFTFTINGTFDFKEDFDPYPHDGVLDESGSGTVTNFKVSVTVSNLDADCEPANFTASVSGSFAFTDNIDPDLSFSMSISTTNPLTITWTTVTGGADVTINGSFTYSDSCFSGSLTVDTTTPLFFPDDEFCPTSGVIVVTGTWTGTLTYTSTGGVQIDNDSDGTVDETLEDCDDAATCPA